MFAAVVGSLSVPSIAQAHQVWIEQSGSSANLRFGEFSENLRETSPGLLDGFVAPTAMLIGAGGSKPLSLTRSASGFVLSSPAAKGESIVAEEAGYPVSEYRKDDKLVRSAWTPAARYVTDLSARTAQLSLDIVPTGQAGQFRLVYQGKPVAKVKVAAVVQSGWAREAHSDEQGLVKFDMPWRGVYVIEAHHEDKTPGQRNGKPFEFTSFVTSLTYDKPDGIEAVPAGPPAAPNK